MRLERAGHARPSGAVAGLFTVEFDQRSVAEASALVAVADRELLSRRGWDLAFWMTRDEPAVEDSIVLIGRRSDASASEAHFEIVPVRLTAQGSDRRVDSEQDERQ